MKITRETWMQCRADYITGKGSLAGIATRYGLRKGSVEKRARKEEWTRLRCEFEAAQLAKLIPPPPPSLPPVPVAVDGVVSREWLGARQEIYYQQNSALLDRVRKLLDGKLADGANLEADELARLTTALGGIINGESLLLGLRDRRRAKKGRPDSARLNFPDPE